MAQDEERIKKTKRKLETQAEIIVISARIKKESKKVINSHQEICVKVSKLIDTYEKNIRMTELHIPFVNDLNEDQWDNYKKKIEDDNRLLDHLYKIKDDIKIQVVVAEEISTVTDITDISATYASGATMTIFGDVVDSKTKGEIEKLDIIPTLSDDIEYIESKIYELFDSTIFDAFIKITKNWSSSGDEDKHNILLNLRSLIFDRLIQPNNEYRKTEWYKTLGDMDYKNRFAKVKFFIIGHKKESEFMLSTLKFIDEDSWRLTKCYEKMSAFGKTGGDTDKIIETYNDTINSFRLVLMLKKRFA